LEVTQAKIVSAVADVRRKDQNLACVLLISILSRCAVKEVVKINCRPFLVIFIVWSSKSTKLFSYFK
jgi:hypothetical protein